MAEKKYLSLERLTEYDALIKSAIAAGDSSTLNSAKSYTNTEIAKITGGTTVVPEATHAVSADSATTASNAAQWTTGRKITLSGDASGNVTIDGTKDVTLTVTVADDSHAHIISNIDGLQAALDGKAASGHNHDSAYDTKGAADTALSSAKSYADGIKNDLLNGAGTAYDTLKELGDLIDDNKDAIDALETIAAGKADAEHSHAIAEVTGLQSALDGKANSSHGTHVTYSTTAPVMDGTASVGTASTVARSDHKHPTDTSRAAASDLTSHTGNTTVHITSTERTNWNAAKTHADSAHAPSNAEKNQNAFSNITVGTTTIAADTATDTLTIVAGSNITLTPDATNDKLTIAATDTTYTGSNGITLSGTNFTNSGVRSIATGTANGTISVNTNGTAANVAVKGLGSAAYTNSTAYDAAGAADTALSSAKSYTDTVASGKSDTGHSHSDATTSAAGFMTAAMVTKLNGIATGANKTTVDSALSSTSANPVQNKVVNSAISTLTSSVSANTNSISSHTTSISNLQAAVAEFTEITSAEIQALFA